jgi:hypothetical protein
MQLTDFFKDVPNDVWAVFEPILPPVVWKGNGRKPKGNRQCFHALLYLLIAGIGWELLPKCFPSYKTVQRRLQRWLVLDSGQTHLIFTILRLPFEDFLQKGDIQSRLITLGPHAPFAWMSLEQGQCQPTQQCEILRPMTFLNPAGILTCTF